jgi:hypothetical protein
LTCHTKTIYKKNLFHLIKTPSFVKLVTVAMDNQSEFIIERGIDIYELPRRTKPGIWQALAKRMGEPKENADGKLEYDSVSKTEDGQALTLKQAIGLANAMKRLGYKGVCRRNGVGYRVWRVT